MRSHRGMRVRKLHWKQIIGPISEKMSVSQIQRRTKDYKMEQVPASVECTCSSQPEKYFRQTTKVSIASYSGMGHKTEDKKKNKRLGLLTLEIRHLGEGDI